MKTPKDFRCERCGLCCLISPFLSPADIKRIRKLGYDEDFFVQKLRGKKFMKLKDGRCVFLSIKRKKATCAIYKARPETCRLYPSELRQDGSCRPEFLRFDRRH